MDHPPRTSFEEDSRHFADVTLVNTKAYTLAGMGLPAGGEWHHMCQRCVAFFSKGAIIDGVKIKYGNSGAQPDYSSNSSGPNPPSSSLHRGGLGLVHLARRAPGLQGGLWLYAASAAPAPTATSLTTTIVLARQWARNLARAPIEQLGMLQNLEAPVVASWMILEPLRQPTLH